MHLLKNPIARREPWLARLTGMLTQPRVALAAAWIAPILFGLLSVAMGQDSNWDLKNYHWYNPYALLNDRLDLDMAPGQWQSYFNPLIDVPYYLLSITLPGPVVGFLMGYVHGLNFVLVMAIARRIVSASGGMRLPLLLAVAGVCGPAFLSQLGNTMGDNLTALLVLSSLLLVLRGWDGLHAATGRTIGLMVVSGLLMGFGTGLKLTNGPYAAALCIALLTTPVAWRQRLALAITHGCPVLAGLLLGAGYWWMTMWERFGNPLFPQFNNIFRSPLAQHMGVIDNHHTPQGMLETVFWPLVFAFDVSRVSELALRLVIVPVVYVLALACGAAWLLGRMTGRPAHAPMPARARFLLVFGLVAYLAWMKLFGIYRYLVPLELLAPLMAWILLQRLMPPRTAARVGGGLLLATSLAVFPFVTWGHADWGSPNVSVQVPPLAAPADTVVFTAHGDPPVGWLAPFFPPEVRVISVTGAFPESPAWLERIRAAATVRPGPHYVILSTSPEGSADSPQRRQAIADEDRLRMQAAKEQLARYRLRIDDGACRTYAAAIGTASLPYRFCPVALVP
ncbi:hypothetical protein ABIB38_001993 [Massilia sp. UYP11]|uniref:hypothetical protein n=1 Tax=Massilia sp. UYP11 TaxID=1756385 RepID=UPI003D1961EF